MVSVSRQVSSSAHPHSSPETSSASQVKFPATRSEPVNTSHREFHSVVEQPRQGRASSSVSLMSEVTAPRRKGLLAGGIGGAVMGFLMGGPPGAIVGAATAAGLGFLLPDIFGKISDFIKGVMGKVRSGADHVHEGTGKAPQGTRFNSKNYTNINELDGGTSVNGQTHYPPRKSGNGDGKTAYFFIGFKKTGRDPKMRRVVEPHLADDIQRLRDNGYKVVVDTSGTHQAFQAAVDDDNAAGIYWAGHGVRSGVQDSKTGRIFKPSQIRPNPNNNMRFTIFECCLTGNSESAWENVLGTDVYAHKRVIYDTEIADFNDPDDRPNRKELDDFITDLVERPWTE